MDDERDRGACHAAVGCPGCDWGRETVYGEAGHLRNSIANTIRCLLTNSFRQLAPVKVLAARHLPRWYAYEMTTDSNIELSGAFQAKDSNGRTLDVKAIRIFDEGYGIIDVYVEFALKLDPGAYKDTVLVRQVIDRLRAVGYKGPDFSHSDPGLQESRVIVLEAPEEFAAFAKSRGWKNLAEDFDE
jgi:hypothetical protein